MTISRVHRVVHHTKIVASSALRYFGRFRLRSCGLMMLCMGIADKTPRRRGAAIPPTGPSLTPWDRSLTSGPGPIPGSPGAERGPTTHNAHRASPARTSARLASAEEHGGSRHPAVSTFTDEITWDEV